MWGDAIGQLMESNVVWKIFAKAQVNQAQLEAQQAKKKRTSQGIKVSGK